MVGGHRISTEGHLISTKGARDEVARPVSCLQMKTDRIRTDITDIIFVFIFLVGFGFEYG